MEKLNVCLMNDSFPPTIDGVANAVENYASILTRRGDRATVVTPFYPDADDRAFDFPVLRYPSIDLTKKVGYRAGMPFSAETLGELERSGFDLIHSHCPISSTILARLLRESIDVPVVFTYHTKFDIDIANAVRSKLLQEEAARLIVGNISACDEVWTVSRGAGENLKKLGFEGRYSVMPNGVDFPKGRVDEALIAQATGGWDLPGDVPLFLFVGRMMWYKGIRIILDALAALKAGGTDFRMVFVGGGGDRDEIMEYSNSLGLGDKVFFSEPVRDRTLIRGWYCRADLFLFPSTFDTNGLVVREAAACELPSVLVAGSCAAEDVTDGVDGFLIEENAESMTAKLKELCAGMDRVRQTGVSAQSSLYMSWEDSVNNACFGYRGVIDNFKRGLYPGHEKLPDELYKALVQIMEAMNTGKERRVGFKNELMDEMDEIKAGLRDGRGKVKEKLWELTQHTDRFM